MLFKIPCKHGNAEGIRGVLLKGLHWEHCEKLPNSHCRTSTGSRQSGVAVTMAKVTLLAVKEKKRQDK